MTNLKPAGTALAPPAGVTGWRPRHVSEEFVTIGNCNKDDCQEIVANIATIVGWAERSGAHAERQAEPLRVGTALRYLSPPYVCRVCYISTMSRSERLFSLLQTLRRYRRPVTGKALAAELNVSLRTVYRDIETLRAQGARHRGRAGAWLYPSPRLFSRP